MISVEAYMIFRSFKLTVLFFFLIKIFPFVLQKSLYTSSSFWRTFIGRQKEYARVPASSQSARRNYLCLLLSNVFNNLIIECGEIDGVVLGSWTNINENPPVPVVDDDSVLAGYWAAAAVWCNVWDQRTIDRVSHLFCNSFTCFSICYTLLFDEFKFCFLCIRRI